MYRFITCIPFMVIFALVHLTCSTTASLDQVRQNSRTPSPEINALNKEEAKRGQPHLPSLKKISEVPKGKGQPHPFFLDKDTGWLWRDKELWKTVNGGKTWVSLFTFGESDRHRILDVSFNSQSKGWLATGTSLFITDDGGSNWIKDTSFAEKFSGLIMSVAARGQRIVVGGSIEKTDKQKSARAIEGFYKKIFLSDDQGASWNATLFPAVGIGSITKVGFWDDSRLIAIGETSRDIFISEDGGRSWKIADFSSGCIGSDLRNGNEAKPVDISFDFARNIWVSYDDGRILTSSGFNRWCDRALPSDVWKKSDSGLAFFRKLCFVNEREGWGLKANGQIWKTLSGGDEWSPVSLDVNYGDVIRVGDGCLFALENGIYWAAPTDQ